MYYINLFFKRIFDIIASLLLILILSPVLLFLAIAVRFDSKGPSLFKQKRLKKNGKIFIMYKFRSMVVDAEKKGAALFNFENDPRVTKIGRFLRKSSLDELPQLFNVLFGQMSFVGPRPPVLGELGDYEGLNDKFRKRFKMKPGITGLAQVSGRNEIEWDEKVTYDNLYIDNFRKFGCFYDLKVLFLTVGKVFGKKSIFEKKPEGGNLSDEELAKIADMRVKAMAAKVDGAISAEAVTIEATECVATETEKNNEDLVDPLEIENAGSVEKSNIEE